MVQHACVAALIGCVVATLCVSPAAAQIPKAQYLRYVPLQHPTIVRQTTASRRFRLFGNRDDAAFRDELPRDGIDDARAAWLMNVATHFAPIMILNTEQFPIDFRTFYNHESFPLAIERWDIARSALTAIDGTTIDMARLATTPCPDATDGDDCRLRALLDTYGPDRRPLDGEVSVPAERETFPVLHFDLPGFDERTWREEYGAEYRARYGQAARTFAHPFIAEVAATESAPGGFEFVIQFWFFYQVNDGPNNHEGDWEHINVVLSPLSGLAGPLNPAVMERLVSGRLRSRATTRS
jgi:hypothetical protein